MIELKVIDIGEIICADRFRKEMGDIDTLAASLKKEGIIQPLAVADREDGKYTLLAGGRRFAACMQAEIREIPVRIYPTTISELQMRSIELMENVCRTDMSWVEATNLKKAINEIQMKIYGHKVATNMEDKGWTQRATAEMLGVTPGGLADDIKLATAMEAFPQLKDAKTKSDANKMLKKLQEQMIINEIANRIKNKQAGTPLEVLHKGLVDNYIIMDFFEGIKKIPDRCVDIVEIDPPYAIGLGTSSIKKGDDSMKTITKDYNEVPAEDYALFLTTLFKECHRVMAEHSWIICWFAQEPWFEVVYQSMKQAGFSGSRIPAIWYKEGSGAQTNHPEYYLGNNYEAFFYMRKGSPSISRQGRGNVYAYKTVSGSRKIHPTERPVELIQDILQTFSWEGCRVLVPFLGSGNTLLAAANLGLTTFGYDLSEEYKDAYIMRVNESRPQSYKSYRSGGEE
jgi:site-specific DNA-methyltransferase (adenine-specific)